MISNKNGWSRDTGWNVPYSWFKAKSISSLVNTCLFSVSLVCPQPIVHFFKPIWETYLLKRPHQSGKDTLPDRAAPVLLSTSSHWFGGCLPHSLELCVFLACLTTQVQSWILILPSSFYRDNSTTFRELSRGHSRGHHGIE